MRKVRERKKVSRRKINEQTKQKKKKSIMKELFLLLPVVFGIGCIVSVVHMECVNVTRLRRRVRQAFVQDKTVNNNSISFKKKQRKIFFLNLIKRALANANKTNVRQKSELAACLLIRSYRL